MTKETIDFLLDMLNRIAMDNQGKFGPIDDKLDAQILTAERELFLFWED